MKGGQGRRQSSDGRQRSTGSARGRGRAAGGIPLTRQPIADKHCKVKKSRGIARRQTAMGKERGGNQSHASTSREKKEQRT